MDAQRGDVEHGDGGEPPRELDHLPSPRGLPWLGHVLQLDRSNPHLTMERWARELGSPYVFRMLRQRIVVWTDPDVMHTVLLARPGLYRRSIAAERVFAELGIRGVASAEGEAWQAQRRLAATLLAPPLVRDAFPALQAVALRLLRRWDAAARSGAVVDMKRDLKRYTIDVTCAAVFGDDLNNVEREPGTLLEALDTVFPLLMRRLSGPLPLWRLIRLPQDRRVERALAHVRGRLRAVIRRAQRRLQRSRPQPARNFLEGLLMARGTPGLQLDSDDDVLAHTLAMLLAGEDSTAQTLAWVLYYLDAHPALQDQLYARLYSAMGPQRVCAGADALLGLDDIEALVTEALRLRPVAPVNLHHPLQDVVLDGVRLPAGTPVVFINRPAMLDPRWFADPFTFDPRRWLRTHEVAPGVAATHHPRAHLQFGTGPRGCPGRPLAGAASRLLLSMLLRNFSLRLAVPRERIREVLAITLAPSELPVQLTLRPSVRGEVMQA